MNSLKTQFEAADSGPDTGTIKHTSLSAGEVGALARELDCVLDPTSSNSKKDISSNE